MNEVSLTGLVPVIHAPRHSHSPLPRRGWPDQVRPRGGREGGSGQTKAGAAGARAGRRPHPIRRQSVGVGSGRLVQSAPLAREELLTIELAELKLEGFDLSLTGFGEVELAGLLDKTRDGPIRTTRRIRPRVRLPSRARCLHFPSTKKGERRPMQMADKIIMRPVAALIGRARNTTSRFYPGES